MHGDHSRVTFQEAKHYSSVIHQQGRAFLDADANEQSAILLHAMRSLTRDMLGAHGVPALSDAALSSNGFRIELAVASRGFDIGAGAYYVDGIRCVNDEPAAAYYGQPHYVVNQSDDPLPVGEFLVYLDVWERHITSLDDPLLRETALGGPDSCTRSQIVWQVKVAEVPAAAPLSDPPLPEEIARLIQGRLPTELPTMRARVRPGDVSTTPCVMPPSGGFRGQENQLYRVEVHTGGLAGAATFKWSRDNGSVVFPVTDVGADSVTVLHLGMDPTRSIVAGDWVELLDDEAILKIGRGRLARVKQVDDSRVVQLELVGGGTLATPNGRRNSFLRRWDHRGARPVDGATVITESNQLNDGWLDLEDGVQVQFAVAGRTYVSGDYWTIAARTGTGQIEWPTTAAGPALLPPTGIAHHYAPLAMVNGGTIDRFRRIVTMTAQPETP